LFVVTLLPDWEFAFESEGEASFDKLDRFFEGDVLCGSQKKVDVVGHNDESVDLKTPP
jgi:hypothetical protein